jgi:hypothetical protein
MNPHCTIPSLSGTFSIRARLAHCPKMLKEPSSPSHVIVPSENHCSKIETFELNEENSQHITMYRIIAEIAVYSRVVARFNFIAN